MSFAPIKRLWIGSYFIYLFLLLNFMSLSYEKWQPYISRWTLTNSRHLNSFNSFQLIICLVALYSVCFFSVELDQDMIFSCLFLWFSSASVISSLSYCSTPHPFQEDYFIISVEFAIIFCIGLYGSINIDANIEQNQTKEVGLLIGSLGHAALLFVNKRLVGKPCMCSTISTYRWSLAISNFIHEVVLISLIFVCFQESLLWKVFFV